MQNYQISNNIILKWNRQQHDCFLKNLQSICYRSTFVLCRKRSFLIFFSGAIYKVSARKCILLTRFFKRHCDNLIRFILEFVFVGKDVGCNMSCRLRALFGSTRDNHRCVGGFVSVSLLLFFVFSMALSDWFRHRSLNIPSVTSASLLIVLDLE